MKVKVAEAITIDTLLNTHDLAGGISDEEYKNREKLCCPLCNSRYVIARGSDIVIREEIDK